MTGTTTEWLIDKSALVRLASSPQATQWAQFIERGLVRITTVTLLEVGYSARSAADLRNGLQGSKLTDAVREVEEMAEVRLAA